jgi:hypothetical protein
MQCEEVKNNPPPSVVESSVNSEAQSKDMVVEVVDTGQD